jgi:RNA polymerase sigma factor (sigma-70 family)
MASQANATSQWLSINHDRIQKHLVRRMLKKHPLERDRVHDLVNNFFVTMIERDILASHIKEGKPIYNNVLAHFCSRYHLTRIRKEGKYAWGYNRGYRTEVQLKKDIDENEISKENLTVLGLSEPQWGYSLSRHKDGRIHTMPLKTLRHLDDGIVVRDEPKQETEAVWTNFLEFLQKRLSEDEYQLFRLHYLEDFTLSEIAKNENTPLKSVKRRKVLLLKRLKSRSWRSTMENLRDLIHAT